MKKLKFFILVLLCHAMISSCKKEGTQETGTDVATSSKNAAQTLVSWETVIPTNSFNSFSTYWNNLYPWGSDHNGSARMRTQNISVSGGVLTLTSSPTSGVGNSSKDPWLPIHYYSGAVHSKAIPVVNDAWPKWRFSAEVQSPSATGTWPAWWITGADSWPPEADIMEFKGSTTTWTNTYKNTSGGWSSQGHVISNPANWHIYTAYLTKINATDVKIEYWIDGTLKATHTGANFVGKRFNIILNYQMEGSSGAPGPTGTTYMKVRNVHVQKSATL